MRISLENAGAEKGFLILNKENKWTIEAEAKINLDEIKILGSIAIDSLDTHKQTPILPITIINYVIRTKQDLVIEDAINNNKYNQDLYILNSRSQSILCLPLRERDNFRGILYLENSLTTKAFTTDRVELLKIIASQAAISIENARLYDRLENYSQNLEKIVDKRTKELSQTVKILKATQAELMFENALLKNDEESLAFQYQVGGSLSIDTPTYVVRAADRYLYKALKRGELAYIFNARQMGKSSLMVRMIHYFQQEDFCCAAIDLTRIGGNNVTIEGWYKGLAVELWRSFGLMKKVNLKNWWKAQSDLPLIQRLSLFIEDILLVEICENSNKNLIIFVDEIDNIFSLNFSVNEFFALIRACYNRRNINPIYHRLTFALIGVATPSDLIDDVQTTPFNIGTPIELEGFKEHEARSLLAGFKQQFENPQIILKSVLFWTNGQPFLTQKICKLISDRSQDILVDNEVEFVNNLVRKKIIDDWEFQDNPEHLKTIRNRIIHSQKNPIKLLKLYRHILESEQVPASGIRAEKELLLSGIVVEEQRYIKVRNPIYKFIFDLNWVEQNLKILQDF